MSEWKQPHIVQRRRLTRAQLGLVAKYLALAVVAAAVLVAYLIFGASLALLGFIPHVAHIVVAVVRRERHRDERSSHCETRVEMSPHGALVRAQVALRSLPLVREPEMRERAVRARTRGHTLTVAVRPDGSLTFVSVEATPRRARLFDRDKSSALARQIAETIANSR